jgi:type II secretory pathway component GspD/PulD (secretin)
VTKISLTLIPLDRTPFPLPNNVYVPIYFTIQPGGSTLNGSQAVLDLLSTLTQVRVVSSPHVRVLNNHAASLDVGDQVPVATSSAISIQATNGPLLLMPPSPG